jgi:hypothetical protein
MAIVAITRPAMKYAFAEQSTWGTAIADDQAMHGLHVEKIDINSQFNYLNPLYAEGQRYKNYENIQANQKGKMFTCEFETPALLDQLDFFLYSLIQNVTESNPAGSVYKKIYTLHSSQPDFSSNGGKFFTLWNVQGISSNSQKLNDLILDKLTLTCAPDANSGILTANCSCVARQSSDSANPSGTITYPSLGASYQYHFEDMTVKIGGTDVVIGAGGITVELENNPQKIGAANSTFASFVLTEYTAKITIEALWDTTICTAISNAKAGTEMTLDISWGSSDTSGYLLFDANQAKVMNESVLQSADEGNFTKFEFEIGGKSGAAPITITMCNENDRSW